MNSRFVVKPSPHWDDSYNVIDTERFNQWGGQWVECVALTYSQAISEANRLNAGPYPGTEEDFAKDTLRNYKTTL